MNIIRTGNLKVDTIGNMNFSGNLIPEYWYQTVLNSNGKPYLLAIMILSEIVYWYRPMKLKDEYSNDIRYKTRFAADLLQLSYKKIEEKFGCSHAQAASAIKQLELLGIIHREFRTIDTSQGKMSNVMYIDINPQRLKDITFPSDGSENKGEDKKEFTPIPEKKDRSHTEDKEVSTSVKVAVVAVDETNTENNTKTSTENPTTTSSVSYSPPDSCDVVVESNNMTFAHAKSYLSRYPINDKDILAILKAANYNIDKIEQAVNALDAKNPGEIRSIVGWLIKAIKNGYSVSKNIRPPRLSPKINANNQFKTSREYDFDRIETDLMGKRVR